MQYIAPRKAAHRALRHWLTVSERPWPTVNELLVSLSTGTGSRGFADIRCHQAFLRACSPNLVKGVAVHADISKRHPS